MNPVAEFLTDVRALVAQGWTQGKLVDRRGDSECFCLMGAVEAVTTNRGTSGRTYELRQGATNALRHQSCTLNLTKWNDAQGRTQEDVLALIDRTIGAVQ